MIEVRGTKQSQHAGDGDELSGRYVLKNQDKRSSAPFFFSIFLTGLALYLKSAFPGERVPLEEAKQEPADEATTRSQVATPLEVAETVTDINAPGPGVKKTEGYGQVFEFRNSMNYLLSDSPVIEFHKLNLPHSEFLKNFDGITVSFHAANDNAWTTGKRSTPSVSRGDTGGMLAEEAVVGPSANGKDEEGIPGDPDKEKTANRAPRTSGPVHLMDVYGCAAALIALADLLRGTYDADGDELLVQNLTVSSGNLTQTAQGWLFDAKMLGPVTVTYQISDGDLSVWQTAQFTVLKNSPVIGTLGDDLLLGSDCCDDIDAGSGDDNVDSRGGNDTVSGGAGNDHIVAGSGNDVIFAGAGDDIVFGGLGDDQIWGGTGDDRLFGDTGRDMLFGESGNDILAGGEGDDMLFGGEGEDSVAGDAGNDSIDGGSGEDRLDGGAGNDVLLGQAGMDILDGGTGDDVLIGGADGDIVHGGSGKDTIVGDVDHAADQYDGGSEIDTLDYSGVARSIAVNLAEGTAFSEEIGFDAISNFEILRAGTGNDDLQGGSGSEEIHGGGGDDLIRAAGADDSLFGEDGDDYLVGGTGSDTVDAGAGADTVQGDLDLSEDIYDGGSGIDTLDYSAALMSVVIDLVAASASGAEIGNDTVTNFEVIKSGAAADKLNGGTGDDTLIGSGGDDVITGAAGADTLYGDVGNDRISDGEGADAVLAGPGDDTVLAAADGANDFYQGEAGFDTLDYSQSAHAVLIDLNQGTATGFDIGQDIVGGFERIVCGAGDDTIMVGAAEAVLEGGAGADTFEFAIPAGSTGAEIIHQILDFMVGDRIEMSKYQIFEDVIDTLEDRFEDVYGDQSNAHTLPIKFSHEGTGELEKTLIEVDMDNDQHYEMTINLSGHHVLMIVENV